MAWARVCVLAMLATVWVGCDTGDPTQLLVVVETDFAVPGELASVHAQVGPDPECDGCSADFLLTGESPLAMPLSFAIAPRDGGGAIALRVEGRDGSGETLVVRTVQTRFEPGKVARVVVRLERACQARTCEIDGETCIAGDCAPDEIAPEILEGFDPGEELPDAGASDGSVGVDAGDGGTVDPPPDGGTVPRSCAGLDGRHRIDPDGVGGVDPFSTWCLDGWTLLLKVDATSTRMVFTNAEWTNPTPTRSGSEMPGEVEDALLESYWTLPVGELRVVMIDGATSREDVFPLVGEGLPVPLVSAVRDDVPVEIGGTLAQWTGLVGADAIEGGACSRVGIPAQAPDVDPAVRVRIGIVASTTADCSQASGWAGIGASVGEQSGCSTFSNTAGGGRLCGNPANRRAGFPRFTLVYGR
ncbi:hypothetical protein [Sandaracinus amylolyticus]|uniref:hypothetical protein n=1 Tax=Sandaracinus amylolyticus TaxID=927083 RepID=UPI001F1B4384|nr:hypothetical protein [Sandaracinus amylolyticus]UJR86838.1 Hypothetical protein I5071_89390 [Sandaracinus amylolyticus]